MSDPWNDPTIRNAERLLRRELDDAEREDREWRRHVLAPVERAAEAAVDDELATLDDQWHGQLSGRGRPDPWQRARRRDAVDLGDGRWVRLNPDTNRLEDVS